MPAHRPALISITLAFVIVATACSDKTPAQPSCTYTVTGTTLSFSPQGGLGSLTLNTGTGCAWTATADSAWVTFPSGSVGSGPSALSFGVSANTATNARTATLTIAGQAIAVSQQGRTPCDYTISPSAIDVGAAGGTTAVDVAAGAGCEWTATPDALWITIASGASGTGSGRVTLTVASNGTADQRAGGVIIASRTVSVRQAPPSTPPPPVACEYSVSPVDTTLHWHFTTLTIDIATAAGCSWTASPSETWLSIDRTSGSGPGAITASFSILTEDATRRAAVLIRWPTPTAGQNSWITQEGCRYGLDGAASFPASGGTRMITVVTQPLSSSCAIGCPWTATANASWIRVASSMPRAGDDAFSYQVDANTGPPRVGTITVAGRTHTVTQAGG